MPDSSSIALAISDSSIARSLIKSGELGPIDFLEVHGPRVDSALAEFPTIPLLLHNSLYNWSLSHPRALDFRDAGRVTLERLAQTQAPWFSVHLGFSAAEVNFGDHDMVALSDPLPPTQLRETIVTTVSQLRDLISVPLLLENLDYCPGGAYEHVCAPAFIRAVLEATDAWMLLDLAHAQVSAHALGIPLADYLAQLPLDRVQQLHVNRPSCADGRLADTHQALQAEDYLLVEELLAQTRPWAITLEYNQDAATLQDQLHKLRRLLVAPSTQPNP